MKNNLVVVGCYYFKQGEKLLSALEDPVPARQIIAKASIFSRIRINIMIENLVSKMRTQSVAVWLDTGTIDATL